MGDAGCAWRLARRLWTPTLVDERRGWGAAEARPSGRPLRTQQPPPPDDAAADNGEGVQPRSADATTGGDDDGGGGGGEREWVQVRSIRVNPLSRRGLHSSYRVSLCVGTCSDAPTCRAWSHDAPVHSKTTSCGAREVHGITCAASRARVNHSRTDLSIRCGSIGCSCRRGAGPSCPPRRGTC